MRTVQWDENNNHLRMIDQRFLPGEFRLATFDDYRQVVQAIKDMVVRGAPAIGAAAAYGLALAAYQSPADDVPALRIDLQDADQALRTARPTAVNLAWALDRVMKATNKVEAGVGELRAAVLQEAQSIADEDIEINKRMATHGATLIQPGETVIHHCNTGALATVDWGTALGVIRMAHEQGKAIHVLVDETRPRLQGARLTAWELEQYGVPYEIISDNAAGYFLRAGLAQRVFVGADRVAANGDVANKIGTYMLALAAKDNGVPFYAVVPTSTIDLSIPSGDQIPIEERHGDEVLNIQRDGASLAPQGAKARNPAFDITPHHLVTAIITEHGVVEAPFDENLPKIMQR